MCEICQNVRSNAQYRARKRILEAEKRKVVKKLTTFHKLLERKFFPERISEYGGLSAHTGEHLEGRFKEKILSIWESSLKCFSCTPKISNPSKGENTFYSFPKWAPDYKIIWIPSVFYYEREGKRYTEKVFPNQGLFYNPSQEILDLLKKNGTEVQFSSAN